MPDISVVIPCYNGEETLADCLESLLRQTIKLHQIIVVNDGSTDGSGAIAQRYAECYNNVLLIETVNQGAGKARQSGLEFATGEYIGFVDCDDWCAPQMYETLFAEISSQDADLVCCGLMKIYENGKQTLQTQSCAGRRVLSGMEALRLLHYRKAVFAYLWNKLYRREMLEGICFPEEQLIGEDYYILAQILPKTRKIAVCQDPLYMFWRGSESASRGGYGQVHIRSYENYKKTEQMLLAQYPEMKKEISAYLAVEYMSFVIAMSRNGNWDYSMIRKIQTEIRCNLISLLGNRSFSMLYKGCAAALCVHYRILTTVYRVIHKIVRKRRM